jgi:hypothetical protein
MSKLIDCDWRYEFKTDFITAIKWWRKGEGVSAPKHEIVLRNGRRVCDFIMKRKYSKLRCMFSDINSTEWSVFIEKQATFDVVDILRAGVRKGGTVIASRLKWLLSDSPKSHPNYIYVKSNNYDLYANSMVENISVPDILAADDWVWCMETDVEHPIFHHLKGRGGEERVFLEAINPTRATV